MERRRRREWDDRVTRIDAERLVKISRTIYLPKEDLQDVGKEYGASKSLIKTGGIAYNKEEKKKENRRETN